MEEARIGNIDEQPRVTATRDTGVQNCYEFKIEREDHTLGNLMTQQLLTEERVLFAGYRIHHPLDDFIYLKVNVSDTEEITNAKDLVENSINTICSDIDSLKKQLQKQLAARSQQSSDVHMRRPYA